MQRTTVENIDAIFKDAVLGFWQGLGEGSDQLGVILNLGLLVGAAITAWFGINTLKQAEHDSRDRTRPYVYADVIPSLGGPGVWDLVLTNTGQSMARNLTLAIDSWPKNMDNVAESIHTLAETPRTLAPGARFRAIWRMELEAGAWWVGEPEHLRFEPVGMPKRAMITTRYESDDPKAPLYSDSNMVILDQMGYTPVPRERTNGASKMDGNTKALYKVLQDISNAVHELRR